MSASRKSMRDSGRCTSARCGSAAYTRPPAGSSIIWAAPPAAKAGTTRGKCYLSAELFTTCPDARARRAPHGSTAHLALGSFWAATATEEVRGAPNPGRTWGGGARRTETRSRVGALGAPRDHHTKGINRRMLVGWERAA